MSSAVIQTVVTPSADDDDFWAQQGDIIDQMVEQHTRERETATQADGGGFKSSGPPETARDNANKRNGINPYGPNDLAPATSTQWPTRSQFDAPPPHLHSSHETRSPQDVLAEKEGMISILKDRCNKAEVEVMHMKRKLHETTLGHDRSHSSRSSHLQKSQQLHLEQQVVQLKQQLAFKEEELTEARRLRLQREERLHKKEEEVTKLDTRLKDLEATRATAEAEMILRMHNPNPRQGAGNGASPAKSQMLRSRSPLKRQQSTDKSGFALVHSNRHGGSGAPALFPPATSSMDWAPSGHSHHLEIEERTQDSLRTHVLATSSDLIGSITSYMYSRNHLLEAQAARALCFALSTNASLRTVTGVLLDYLRNHTEEARGSPQAYKKAYEVSKGKSCLDYCLSLLHTVLSLDTGSREVLATFSSPSGDGEAEGSGLGALSAALGLCACNRKASTRIVEMMTMAVTWLDAERRDRCDWVFGTLVGSTDLQALACKSGGEDLAISVETLLFHLLESPRVVDTLVRSDPMQVALFRFLERTVEFGVIPHHSSGHGGNSSSSSDARSPGLFFGREGPGLGRTLVVNRQGLRLVALVYRQVAGHAERGGHGEGAAMGAPLPPVLLGRLGKVASSAMKLLGALLGALEAPGSTAGGHFVAERDLDDVLACVCDSLRALQILFCDTASPAVSAVLFKAAMRSPSQMLHFHDLMDSLIQGRVQVLDQRRWEDMAPALVRVPSFSVAHEASPAPSQCVVETITDLAEAIYHHH